VTIWLPRGYEEDAPVNDENEQCREVYASFGLACYMQQLLERELAIMLATSHRPPHVDLTRTGELMDTHFALTLGRLVKALIAAGVPETFRHELEQALKQRNWLTHSYFWERAADFMIPAGRAAMIEELRRVAHETEDLHDRLIVYSRRWRAQHGITDDVIGTMMETIQTEAKRRHGPSESR